MSEPVPLVDLLVRQRDAWRRGERPTVEALLVQHPHLGSDRDALLDLVYNEHLLREEFGPAIPIAEFTRRFPSLADDLRVQFEVDQALTVEDAAKPDLGATVFAPTIQGDRETLPALEGCDLLGELGRGAMGVVYRGWQRGARRPVAVKVLSADVPAARVRIEAEAASRLIHPNIVQVFEVKQLGDRTALVLEYVEGGNLAQKLGGKPQTARDSARLLETMAWAMAYAHSRGVIHRDLKPSNVLLSGGPDAALGQTAPKIGDFGLAKLLEGHEPALTRTTDILGTPSYMAPEQTGIAIGPVGPAADVYSLGAILYECLTGRPPFLGQNVLDTLDQVRHSEPVAPSRLQPKVPRDLEVICLACLRKEPGRRYGSARELAEDLRRFQNHEPIRARPAGPLERAWKLARRRPVAASLLAAGLAAGLVLLVGGLLVNRALRTQRDFARRQADELDDQLGQTRQLLYTAQLLRVGSVWEGDPLQGLAMLEDPRACPPDLRCFSWRVLHTQCKRFRESVPVPGGADAVAVGLGSIAWAGPGGAVYLRRGSDPIRLEGQTANVVVLAFTRDGKHLASAARDGRIVVWDVPSGVAHSPIDAPRGTVGGLAWQADGRVLAVNSGPTGGAGTLCLIDIRTGKRGRIFKEPTSLLSGVAVGPDGNTVACADRDRAVRLWDVRTGRPRGILKGHTAPVTCLAFAASGKPLVSGSLDGTVFVWDAAREVELDHFTTAVGAIRSLALDATGQGLAVAGAGPTGAEAVADVQVWDLVSRRGSAPLKGHPGSATSVAFSAETRSLVTAGADGSVKLWDHPARREGVILRNHTGKPDSVALSRDGRTLAWVTRGDRPGSRAHEIVVYDLEKAASGGAIRGHGRPAPHVALDPRGRLLASGAGDADEPAEVLVWEMHSVA